MGLLESSFEWDPQKENLCKRKTQVSSKLGRYTISKCHFYLILNPLKFIEN
jgi:hypothetical protein